MSEEIRNQMKYIESLSILRWLLKQGIVERSVLEIVNKKNAIAWKCKAIELA